MSITASAWQQLEQAVMTRLAYYKVPAGPLKVIESHAGAERLLSEGVDGLLPAAAVWVADAQYPDLTMSRRHRTEQVTLAVAILYHHPHGNKAERWTVGNDPGMYLMAQSINGLLMDFQPLSSGLWASLTPTRQFVDRRDKQYAKHIIEYRTSRTIEPTDIVEPVDLVSIYGTILKDDAEQAQAGMVIDLST